MSIRSAQSLKIGKIIDKALAVLERCMQPVAIFVVAVTLVNGAIAYFTADMQRPTDQLVLSLLNSLIGAAAAYFLLNVMLERTNLRERGPGDLFLRFLGLGVVQAIATTIGFILIIIPGLILMARWVIAPTLMLARGEGIKQSLGDSWERTQGAEFTILVALFALLLPLIVVIVASDRMFDPHDIVGIVVEQLARSLTSPIGMAIGVAIYGMLETPAVAPATPAD